MRAARRGFVAYDRSCWLQHGFDDSAPVASFDDVDVYTRQSWIDAAKAMLQGERT